MSLAIGIGIGVPFGGVTGPAPWTPAQITTELWYDAADATTITESGGAVSQWDDKSGNGRHATQGTGSFQPVTGATTLGGLNVIDADGAKYMSFTGTHAATWSAAMVGRINTGFRGYFQFGAVNTLGSILRDATDTIARMAGGSDSKIAGAFSTPELICGEYGTTNQVYLDGTAGTPSGALTPTAASGAASTVFALSSSIYRLDGYIAEIIVYDGIDTTTRQDIEGYLSWKWSGAL